MVNCNINTSDHFCKYTVFCVCVDLEYNLTCPRVCWSSFTLAEISLNPRKDTTLLHLVSVVRSQSCSATVFGTDLPERQSSTREGLFINAHSPASCSGILTLWHYCFYNENAGDDGIARFAIHRRDSANSYSRVYTEERVSVSPIPSSPTFSCHTLTPSQSNFQVEPDDIILACISSNNPLDVLAETASGYQVYASKNAIGGCGGSSIPDSISLSDGDSYELLSGFAIHVYAGEFDLNVLHIESGFYFVIHYSHYYYIIAGHVTYSQSQALNQVTCLHFKSLKAHLSVQ